MSLDHWFRLSGYLALALSCAALVFALAPFLPDLQICLPPVLALLLLAWWVEGRWRLPNWGANLLGVFIVAGGFAWLAGQLTDNDSLLMRIPVHLALLPYMGPLLIAALLVKLFGSIDADDFWRLQGLGLMQIGLGCVLDGGPVFGGLMIAYFAAALTCLALRYRLYAGQRDTGPPRALSARGLAAFTLRWTLLIIAPALGLFLFTPRRDNGAWEPLNGLRSGDLRVRGGSEEINLNDTGRVELGDEVVLQAAAVDASGQPKLDLPLDQRWRGHVLDWYENGKWRVMHRMPMSRGRQHILPDFGPHQYFLTFTVPPRHPSAVVLAEPVRLGPPSARLPVVVLSDARRPRLFYELAGSVLPLTANGRREHRYRQVVPADGDSSGSSSEGIQLDNYPLRLAEPPPLIQPSLFSWTVDLLRRLARGSRNRLPKGVHAALAQPTENFLIDPDDWEAVARVLTDYLAGSGEFTYTLYLTRHDRSIDPVLDFLFNVKQGHCERFATALALMLRSVGIPARLVKGFRGCESVGDGYYVVRQRHAHAWVEILLPHRSVGPASVGPASRRSVGPASVGPVSRRSVRSEGTAGLRSAEGGFEWLELDPTPPEQTPAEPRFLLTYFWEQIQRIGQQSWQTLIVDYNADEQADLWDMLRSGRLVETLRKLGVAIPAFAAVLCARLLLRRLRRSRRTNGVRLPDITACYQRLTHILGRYTSLRPSCGQTPREYGEAARAFLATRPGLAAVAELPIRVVDSFYRVRFGGQSLNEGERLALDAELDRFAEVLRAEPRP
ncbi:MAG TPA: transglutaminaseTgpA domain-containing protein [Gemmataceae bacterium]|nr:transglutaminaseTgpA domain-containing protein [Gemmataceae bacterium]